MTKQIETLKQEKESLAIDKSKLKSDLKSTEKELKKANASLSSAKSEIERLKAKTQKHSTAGMGEGVEELQERVRQLEAELSEKRSNFRQGVGGQLSQPDSGDGHTDNDSGMISSLQHQLHIEQQARGKLKKENSELRSQVRNLESDLNQLIQLVDTQQEEDVVSNADPSDLSSGNTLGNIIKRRGQNSPSPFSSPRNSPALQRKNQASVEVSTLQNCLKLALEEKATAEGQRESLHTQLIDVKSQLEEAKEAWEQEKGRLLQQIRELQTHAENESKQNREALEKESHQLQKELQEARETSEKDSSHTQTETGSSIGPRTNSTQQTPTTEETGSHIGSRTDSTQQRATSEDPTALKSDPAHAERGNDEAKSGKKYMNKGRQISRLKKQQSRENFTSALAVFQSGEAGVSLSKPAPKRERSTSETAASGSSVQSSALSAPTDSSKLTTENRSQSVNVVGKPPVHPSSSASGSTHPGQNSADDSSQKSPKKRKLSWTIAQKRQSFEQAEESSSTSTVQHSRTASSPTASQTPDSPLHSREVESKEKMQTVDQKKQAEEEKARRQKEEKQQKELEAEERRKKELEKKIQQEAEEKERKMKEREERERLRREREEREKERKRELEEKKRQEAEEKEQKRQVELEKKRELEEKKRQERQAQQEPQRVKKLEQEKQRMAEREAALKREKEAEEQKKREEEEKKRVMLEEERKRTEASLNRQREQERGGETENERKVRLEEEKRRVEKEAQAAVEPKPNKRQIGSIAMRRQAYEQKASPSSSPPISLRRSPAQRPKSMDVGVMLSTPSTTSSSLSPTPQSSNLTSISVKTSKSPQGSPLLGERKEIKEVVVGKPTPITKPSPPISAIGRVPPVSVVTTTSSPPLRRAQTISSTSAIFQAKSTPDLTSVGTSNGSLGSRSPTTQHKMMSPTTPKSPLSEKRMAKTVSFSPSVSTASKPPGILKPSAPVTTPYMMNGRLSVPGAADMKKAQSLQNIPENAPSDPVSPSHVVRRNPAVQRRPRSERAKTTSLSPTDMASLTNILSKMQDKERSPEKPVANGVGPPPRIGSTRPVSMYGSITPTRYIVQCVCVWTLLPFTRFTQLSRGTCSGW